MQTKTYNSGDSLVVTHLTTNPPVSCLNRAERTGSLVLKILWSYVEEMISSYYYQEVAAIWAAGPPSRPLTSDSFADHSNVQHPPTALLLSPYFHMQPTSARLENF
jgi:hypothetical protein